MVESQFPQPASESLPTMYDLPSEYPEEPGLPDEFHDFQPQLLRETCQIPPAVENRGRRIRREDEANLPH